MGRVDIIALTQQLYEASLQTESWLREATQAEFWAGRKALTEQQQEDHLALVEAVRQMLACPTEYSGAEWAVAWTSGALTAAVDYDYDRAASILKNVGIESPEEAADRQRLLADGKTIKLYRGAVEVDGELEPRHGIAWTHDRGIAKWYATLSAPGNVLRLGISPDRVRSFLLEVEADADDVFARLALPLEGVPEMFHPRDDSGGLVEWLCLPELAQRARVRAVKGLPPHQLAHVLGLTERKESIAAHLLLAAAVILAAVLIIVGPLVTRAALASSQEELVQVLRAADRDGDGRLTLQEMQARVQGAQQRVERRAWQMVLGYPSDQLTSLSRSRRARASALADAIREALQL